MGNTPLIVAGVAAALLVVVLGVDATMSAVYVLDIWTGDAWRELARDPYTYDGRAATPYGFTTIGVNASDGVQFRLRVENTYAWGVSETFRAYQNGDEVSTGTIAASGGSNAEREFSIPAARYFSPASAGGTREPVKAADPSTGFANGDLQVEVDGRYLYASFQLQEVSK